jgi:hypothetical protein
MNPRLALRCCVFGFFALLALGAAVDLLFPSSVPHALREAAVQGYLDHSRTGIFMWLFTIGALVGAACLVGAIGLLFSRPWSRPVALWSTILATAIYPFLNSGVVLSGWSMALLLASQLLWGAALALAYFSEASLYFVHGR